VSLSRSERLDWLQLIRTDSIGPITFHRLIERFKDAKTALAALPRLSREAGRASPMVAAQRDDVEAELAASENLGAELVASCEPNYPAMLQHLPDRPPVLCMKGHAVLADKPCVAVIGTRNASSVGKQIARRISIDLGAAGVVVVSGLARGIDGAAHAAALDSGTIAAVAGGVDVIYPPEHEDLTRKIAERGLIVSERPIGHQPTARDFPRRNRLISGLSRGVLVVEAAARSGTLITARFALEQGRDVFAVPGSPLDPRCQGANRLIRDGATLVETAEDILQALAEQNRGAREGKTNGPFDWPVRDAAFDAGALSTAREKLFEALSFTPTHRDELFRDIDAPRGVLADALLDLVLSGEVEEHSGGYFARSAR
jgi:DNA processing protein